ncbi:MAG: hypothetical protein HRT88_13900 [Lentisphaeraceae bacterium]|nr:hypothetical protein [Lentisphaeraceae bacterium]
MSKESKKLKTVQNGKGSKPRQTNSEERSGWENSKLWDNIKKKPDASN